MIEVAEEVAETDLGHHGPRSGRRSRRSNRPIDVAPRAIPVVPEVEVATWTLEPAYTDPIIDVPTEHRPAAVIEILPAAARTTGDRDDMIDELRRVRAELVEERVPTPAPSHVLPAATRAVRVTTTTTNGRKRWKVDFLVRQPDVPPDQG